MARAIDEALKSPETLDKLDKAGAKSTYLGPAALRAQITADSTLFADVIKRGNVKAE